eukprot:scaffold103266_cov66-Phaeocystis_antarctica.AAC.11
MHASELATACQVARYCWYNPPSVSACSLSPSRPSAPRSAEALVVPSSLRSASAVSRAVSHACPLPCSLPVS